MINLGDKVKDKVTGMEGIAVCRTEWVYGCVRFGVQSETLHEGKPIDAVYFDEPQLVVLSTKGKTAPPQSGGGRENERRAMSRG